MNCVCIIIFIFMFYILFIDKKKDYKSKIKNTNKIKNKYSDYVDENIKDEVDIDNLLLNLKNNFNKGKKKLFFNTINYPPEKDLGTKVNIKGLLDLIFKNIDYKLIKILNIDKLSINKQILLNIDINLLINNNYYNIFIKVLSERDEQFEIFYYENLNERNYLLELNLSEYNDKKYTTIKKYLEEDKNIRYNSSKMILLPKVKNVPLNKYLES